MAKRKLLNSDLVKQLALENDGQIKAGMTSWEKIIQKKGMGKVRINVWETGTISIALLHPKHNDGKSRNQQYKKNVGIAELRAIFKNPRVHTTGGYRRREEKIHIQGTRIQLQLIQDANCQTSNRRQIAECSQGPWNHSTGDGQKNRPFTRVYRKYRSRKTHADFGVLAAPLLPN